MRYFTLVISFLLFFNSTPILSQNWMMSKVVQASTIEPRYSAIDNNNNLVIIAQFTDTLALPINIVSYGSNDLFLLKFSPTGVLLWYNRIGNTINDVAGGLVIDNSNSIYISGAFSNTVKFGNSDSLSSTGNSDVFLAKYNSEGAFLWAKNIAYSSTIQSVQDLKLDYNGNLIISGFFVDSLIIGNSLTNIDTLIGNTKVSNFIARLNSTGDLLWVKRYLGSSNLTRFKRIAIADNGYYIGGFFQGSVNFDLGSVNSYVPTTFDAFVFKIDLDGNEQWIRCIKGQFTENFRTLTTDEYDNLYILGNYNSSSIFIDSTQSKTITYSGNSGGYDTFLGKYNRSGILQWFLRKGSTAKDIYNDFVVRNNVIYATGYFTNQIIFNNDTLRTSSSLNSDAFVAAFNQIGDPISGVSIVGTGNYEDAGTIVNMDRNSRAYVSGYYKSPQIQIGSQTYTSNNINKSDLFFAIYQQPFKAVITDEDMISCNGLSDGMLKVTPYFGRPPYTYSWSHNPSLNSDVAENLSAGDYTVTVTDANDSVASITGRVSEPQVLSVQGLLNAVSCSNGQDGGINITVTGGTPGAGYEYFWTSLDGSGIIPLNQDQINLTAGTYTVQVKDANLCADTVDFIVTEPQPFNYTGTTVTSIIKPIVPSGRYGQVNLSVTGGTSPYSFSWTGPDGYSASTEDIANLDTAGLYNLTLTDDNNCTSDTAIAVIDNFTFVAQIIAKTNVVCYGANNGTAKVRVSNGTPPYSYQWSDGVTLSDSVRTGMPPANYIVTVTDGAAKTAQASVTITSPSAALTIVLDPEDLACNGDNSGVVDLTVTGGILPYSFLWNNGYTGEDLVNVPADVYTVTVTDANNCTAQDTKEVKEPDAIGLAIVPSGQILCHGDLSAIATANATGGTPPGSYSYLWDDPGAQTTQTAYDLGAGTWHVTVTDSNNCSKTAEITILEPDPLELDVQMINPSCPGLEDGSIIPTPSGGVPAYEYIWSNNVFQRFNTDIPAGEYILTLNDNNNCVRVDTFRLSGPDTLKITELTSTDVTCLGRTDGTISITSSGGTGVYNYSSDGGNTFVQTPLISNLDAGEYAVMVSDESDCESETIPVSITIADTVTIDELVSVDPTCSGIDNGSISITASGGSGNYEYSTDGGSTFAPGSLVESLAADSYEVVAMDENDCQSPVENVILVYTDTVTIADIQITDVSCSGTPDGILAITAEGGAGNYQYSADGGTTYVTTATIGSLAEGDYTLVVKDQDDCVSEESGVTISKTDVCGLVIYDAFSPDGNDKNEVWNIGNAGSFPNIKVKIFNLWGKMVFSSNGYGTPWDGTFNGNDLPAGTYYYMIDPGDGSEVITGDVSIVK